VLDRTALLDIDESKLGPDSPLRPILRRLRGARQPRRDLEHLMQVQVIDWAREHETQYPALAWLYAVPNGARLTIAVAKRMKAEGMRPGVPDLMLPERRGSYVGLAIELKAGRNTPTRDQKLWLNHLKSQGWLTDVCYSFAWARDLILAYLSGARYDPTYQEK
jgi:hypothetical protein